MNIRLKWWQNIAKNTCLAVALIFIVVCHVAPAAALSAIPFFTIPDSNTNQTKATASNNTINNKDIKASSNNTTSSNELNNDDSINLLLSILKDPQKRNQLIKQLEQTEEVSKAKNQNNITQKDYDISNKAIKEVRSFFMVVSDGFKAITKIDVFFLNTYNELKIYSANLVTAVLKIPNAIKEFLYNENFISQVTYTGIAVLTILLFMFVSYIVERNINLFIVSHFSQKQRGNKFLDKLIYVGLALLTAFIPVVGASILVAILSLVCFSLVSVFFSANIVYVAVVVKFAVVWILFRTLLIFVRKMLLVSFILNFWGYLKATYKDVRDLYIWFRTFLILLFIFILSFIVIPIDSDIMLNLHAVLIKIFFIVFAVVLFIFLYRFKIKIQNGLLIFAGSTKYFYIRKLFKFLSKRFYILALIYVLVVLSSFVLGNYGSLFYFLNATVLTIVLIIIHHFLQYFGAKYIKSFFSHNFVELIEELYSDDKNKKKLYTNILGNPKLELLLEGVFYYMIFFVFCLFVLQGWGLNTLEVIKYIYEIPIIKPITQIIMCFVLILAITLFILLSFRQRIVFLSNCKRFEDINKVLSVLLLFKNIYIIACIVVMLLVALNVFGVPVATLIASTGIITLLVAFGARDIMRNFFNALISVLESTFTVGDYVTISSSEGTVEDITSAYVKIRDVEGKLHIIPFSEVTKVINETKEFSYAYSIITIDYGSNLDKVLPILYKTAETLLEDPAFNSYITAPLDVVYTYNLTAGSIDLRCRIKTKPGQQWTVKREFLRRVKQAFYRVGKEIQTQNISASQYLIK